MKQQFLALVLTLLVSAPASAVADSNLNVLMIIVDNMRPSLGAYGAAQVLSPAMDSLADDSALFARAYCQLAWCAPSRNSFLSGRRPDTTRAWGFLDDFRDVGANWTSLPQHFKNAGYYTTSVGKVFHPNLPANFDYPASWSDMPVMPDKPGCPNKAMYCALNTSTTADTEATALALERLAKRNRTSPFFLAVGYQSPRLPWSYPLDVAKRYPKVEDIDVALHMTSPDTSEDLEWFRPTEVNQYSNIQNITHEDPLHVLQQREARLAYYSAISHVDDQVATLMKHLRVSGLLQSTVVVLCADHGQNLGENNMWSMMNVLETSLQVPLMIRHPAARPSVYPYPVELVDLFPTMAALAGIPPLREPLPGTDLSGAVLNGSQAKAFALGQITRCFDCQRAYSYNGECSWDSSQDKQYTVPCCKTFQSEYDWMGMSMRTSDWRYVIWCQWDGARLKADWTNCTRPELYDHRGEKPAIYDVDHFENSNLALKPQYSSVVSQMHLYLKGNFTHSQVLTSEGRD